jgi:ribonuclease J
VIHSHSDLPTPPKLAADTLRVIPLGGLGDIGRNMATFEINGQILIVDCGVLFPEESQPGVDLILPDFDYLQDRWADIVAVVLTHGHEDHIGALPYLLRNRADIPVYGTQLTLAFAATKLKEHRITGDLRAVTDRQEVSVGEFNLEFLAVTHSIPDAAAIAITTKAGVVLHTGDFKMDQLPLDGRITDLSAFARLGDAGVDLFMVDSTNAEVPGFVPSERDIIPVLDQVFNRAPGRIVVASFASHVHRIQQVIDIAVKHNRKIALVGRSMVRNMTTAIELGYLKAPVGTIVSADKLEELAPERIVLVSTGSQGEPMAALARMASNDHRISIGPDDTVVLASSLIPGNENSVNRVINGLTRLGAQVVHKGNALVHVSGHAAAGELLYAYNLVKPKNVMPIHGEARHLRANANVAIKTGVLPHRVHVIEDGMVVDLKDGIAQLVGAVDCGYVFVDGASVGDISEVSLKDRRILGEEGFISCVVAVDVVKSKVVAGPEIHARGFAEDDTIFDPLIPLVVKAIEFALQEGMTDPRQLSQVVRRVVGKWVADAHRRKPMIVPVVIEA